MTTPRQRRIKTYKPLSVDQFWLRVSVVERARRQVLGGVRAAFHDHPRLTAAESGSLMKRVMAGLTIEVGVLTRLLDVVCRAADVVTAAEEWETAAGGVRMLAAVTEADGVRTLAAVQALKRELDVLITAMPVKEATSDGS